MARPNVLIATLLVLIFTAVSPSVSAQQPDIVSVTNGIFEVFVQSGNYDIGTYTIRTGSNHPATQSNGFPQTVLFGDDAPGSTYNTIRSYTSQTDYVTDTFHYEEYGSSFTVVELDDYVIGTTVVGTNEIQTVWELPGPPATPDKLQIVQKIIILGSNFSDSSVKVNILVTNLNSIPVDIGVTEF